MPGPPMNLRTCLAAILLLGGSSLPAAEPQATFALVDGFLEIGVQQDGVGVKDVRVRVLDLAAEPVADGECDEQGRGTLGLSNDSTFLVGITVPGKKKEADLITLRREGKAIVPARVLLSFSKPCCRVVFSSAPETDHSAHIAETPDPPKSSAAWIMLGGSGVCMLAAGMMLLVFRRPDLPRTRP